MPVPVKVGAPLGPREREALRYAATGNTNPQIAELMGISTTTATDYLRQCFVKLAATNRAEAVAWLIRQEQQGEITRLYARITQLEADLRKAQYHVQQAQAS